MSRATESGQGGERDARTILEREGWKFPGRHVRVHGHLIDLVGIHPITGEEWLIEVKTWGAEPSGKDTVKKAIADAYDFQQLGEPRPFMLFMSHLLGGIYGDMIRRARRAGAINDVRVIEAVQHYDEDDDDG